MKNLLLLLLLPSIAMFSQLKELKPEEFKLLLERNNGLKLNNIPVNNSIYFIFEHNNNWIKFDIQDNKYFFIENYDKYISTLKEIEKESLMTPLFKSRKKMENIDIHKDSLISDFINNLSINRHIKYRDYDLDLIDLKIKECGYRNIYNDYFLNLILFCGEYVIEMNGKGGWNIETSVFYPLEYTIKYIDENNKKISIQGLVKEFLCRENRDEDDVYINSIHDIIEVLRMDIFD